MNYDNTLCPFDLSINEEFTSKLTDGSCVTLKLTEKEGELTFYRCSGNERVRCAVGLLPILKDLVAWAQCYAQLEKAELAYIYRTTLGYLVSQLFAPSMIQHLMEHYAVDSTIDLVELLLNQGKLNWLQEL